MKPSKIGNVGPFAYQVLRKSFAARWLRKGFKYATTVDYTLELINPPVKKTIVYSDPDSKATIEIVRKMTPAGGITTLPVVWVLRVSAGYPWDGVSGPTLDTPKSLPGSLPHDALYELMRAGVLPQSCRRWADQVALAVWERDDAPRRSLYYWALRWFGGFAARRKPRKK